MGDWLRQNDAGAGGDVQRQSKWKRLGNLDGRRSAGSGRLGQFVFLDGQRDVRCEFRRDRLRGQYCEAEHGGRFIRGGIFYASGPAEFGGWRHGSRIWWSGHSGGPADWATPAFDDWRRKRRQLLFTGPRQYGRVRSKLQSGGLERGAEIFRGERDIFYGGVL